MFVLYEVFGGSFDVVVWLYVVIGVGCVEMLLFLYE